MLTNRPPPLSGRGSGLQLAPRLAAIWRRLTEPPAAIQDPQNRRRARLLSTLLVVIVPLAALSSLIGLLGIPEALEVRSLLSGLIVLVCPML